MAQDRPIRIGFIGAGSICRSQHLPRLARIPGAKVVAVSNRSRESSQKVAADFDIPDIIDDWQELLRREDIDAVFIGTWPNMHREISEAALAAGKHVFCQARMARTLEEARAMVAAAEAHPKQVNMICPPPHRMPFEPFIKDVIAQNRLGPITGITLQSVTGANLNSDKVTWREDAELSGRQILAMGIWAETLNAWFGEYETLSAVTSTPIPQKTQDGRKVPIGIPQVVQIQGRLASGALISEYHTGLAVDTDSRGDLLVVHGLEGTLRYKLAGGGGEVIELGKPGESLSPVEVPAGLQRPWQVEQDFNDAVHCAMRGQPWNVSPDFAEGLAYMKKVEAVHVAAASGAAVRLAEL